MGPSDVRASLQRLALVAALICGPLCGSGRARADEGRKLETYRTSAELFESAAAAEGRGLRDEARKSYTQAVERDPDFVEALVNLARLELADGRLEAAAGWLERAERLRSDYPRIAATRGLLALAGGDLPRALDALGQAHRMMPEDAEIAVNLGAALIRRSRFAEARQVLAALLRSQPDHAEAIYNLALADDLAGERDLAQFGYRRFLALSSFADPDREGVQRRLEELSAAGRGSSGSVRESDLASEVRSTTGRTRGKEQ